MGLVTGVLTLPLAPLRGVAWLAEQLRREALEQWTDPTAIRAQLEDVHEQWLAGELSDGQRAEQEDALLARLLARKRVEESR